MQKHRSCLEIMMGMCKESYLIDNDSPWSNCQHCLWVKTENKNVPVIIVLICDVLYTKKVQADEAVCKYVIQTEKRTS